LSALVLVLVLNTAAVVAIPVQFITFFQLIFQRVYHVFAGRAERSRQKKKKKERHRRETKNINLISTHFAKKKKKKGTVSSCRLSPVAP
jgi:hypothetical protein